MAFAVVGTTKVLRERRTLRRFPTEREAIEHALRADMRWWDDVWVEKCEPVAPKPEWTEPVLPFRMLWVGGYAYLIDAEGRKLASILGNQRQREWMTERFIAAGLVVDAEET